MQTMSYVLTLLPVEVLVTFPNPLNHSGDRVRFYGSGLGREGAGKSSLKSQHL